MPTNAARTGSRRRRTVTAAALVAGALVAAGCASSEPTATPTTQASAIGVATTTTTTTAAGADPGAGAGAATAGAAGGRPGRASGGSTPSSVALSGPNAELDADVEAVDVTWNLDATEYGDQIGALVAYECTPDGIAATVWGVDTYTHDSSVCTAAVHAGLISFADGGRVVIRIEPGQDSYEGSTANGVTTLSYGSWGGSFVFPNA